MSILELIFQGLAFQIPKDQIETALLAGTTDGGAAAREALLALVGSNVKRKTAQPEQPTMTANATVPRDDGTIFDDVATPLEKIRFARNELCKGAVDAAEADERENDRFCAGGEFLRLLAAAAVK